MVILYQKGEQMTSSSENHANDLDGEALLLPTALKSLEARISRLECAPKSRLKSLTENAGVAALILGLVLTISSLYDVFFAKPESDRIQRIGQFNEAMHSAVLDREEQLKALGQGQAEQSGAVRQAQADETTQLAAKVPKSDVQSNDLSISAAKMLAMVDLSTARALLRDIRDDDVGVPQLDFLEDAAVDDGDNAAADDLAKRAIAKKNVSPYLHSEAERQYGVTLERLRRPEDARHEFQLALATLGDGADTFLVRSYILNNWIVGEYSVGDCLHGSAAFARFLDMLQSTDVPEPTKHQIAVELRENLRQVPARCPVPDNFSSLP
jgi:hypothetical protein